MFKNNNLSCRMKGSKAMNKLSPAVMALAVMAFAGVASAQENVDVTGDAPARCTLPDSWTFVTANGGAAGSTFSGTTWSIPANAFATANAAAVTGQEYAIRIRGVGFCNVSHQIKLKSLRGGLLNGNVGDPVPAGFANLRVMNYEANWSASALGSTERVPFGPMAELDPTSAGQEATAAFVVSDALAPPGARSFDVRLGMVRDTLSAPLVAGNYTDQLVVTLAPNP